MIPIIPRTPNNLIVNIPVDHGKCFFRRTIFFLITSVIDVGETTIFTHTYIHFANVNNGYIPMRKLVMYVYYAMS